ncbi:hypothetical protein HN51_033460 [Arachis hypogaea]|nr:uncharacterized protein DS421_10g316650 [Arachis hypogaea]
MMLSSLMDLFLCFSPILFFFSFLIMILMLFLNQFDAGFKFSTIMNCYYFVMKFFTNNFVLVILFFEKLSSLMDHQNFYICFLCAFRYKKIIKLLKDQIKNLVPQKYT